MIGTKELIIILVLVLLLFGELVRSMGKSIGEFKKTRTESEKEMKEKWEV